MLTRREVLIGAIAIGAMMRVRTGLAKASQPGTPVDFEVPAGACDCHTDIHGSYSSHLFLRESLRSEGCFNAGCHKF